MMTTQRWALLAALAAGCGEAPAPLEWITPDDGAVPAGDVVELAVTTPDPEAGAVRFLVDGEEVGACDPAQAEEDCKLGDVWRWSAVLEAGAHTIGAAYDGPDGPVTIERAIDVVAPPSEEALLAAEQQVEPDDGTVVPEEQPALATLVGRGLLDPDRGFHRIFGGIEWSVNNQRVVLRTGVPRS